MSSIYIRQLVRGLKYKNIKEVWLKYGKVRALQHYYQNLSQLVHLLPFQRLDQELNQGSYIAVSNSITLECARMFSELV